jgi:hypothetical protein
LKKKTTPQKPLGFKVSAALEQMNVRKASFLHWLAVVLLLNINGIHCSDYQFGLFPGNTVIINLK